MIGIEKTFYDNDHYENVLGDGGNAFANAISWLFTDKATPSESQNYCLRGRVLMRDFMSCVYVFINAAMTKLPEQTISDHVSILRQVKMTWSCWDDMGVKTHKHDGKDFITFTLMDQKFIECVIWSAYIFMKFHYEINKDNQKYKKAGKALYIALFRESGLKEEAFKKHFLVKNIKPTMLNYLKEFSKQIEDTPTTELDTQNDYQDILRSYIEDSVYGQCYPGLVSVLGNIGRVDGREYSVEDYLNIYREADELVKSTLESDYPEIEISKVQSRLINKYANVKSGNMTGITAGRQIGCLIEMVYIIALWDKMEHKSTFVQQAFESCRNYVEDHDTPYIYTSNDMWLLICRRIHKSEKPRIEDLQVEIESLKEIISNMKERLRLMKDGYVQENDKQETGQYVLDSILEEKDRQIQELKEQLAAYESGPIVSDPHIKVRLEILVRFFEESEADFKKHGNKAEAARMFEFITGLPYQTCKNYMTERNLNTANHNEEVLKVNTSLKKLNIKWQL